MTTYAQMLELSDPPDAYVRGHGWGSVRVLMAGSLNANPSCWVRLYGSGKVLWVDQMDLRLAHNPGDERDGIEVPEEWKPLPMVQCEGCGRKHQYAPEPPEVYHDLMCPCGARIVLHEPHKGYKARHDERVAKAQSEDHAVPVRDTKVFAVDCDTPPARSE